MTGIPGGIQHTHPPVSTRRSFLATSAGAAASAYAETRSDKPLRGIFVIAATPYTESKAVDYEDLAREIDWQNRCGAHGIVWPQMASAYNRLTAEERLHGFEVIADAAKGKPAAVVFGVQGPDTAAALNYLRHAEKLSPDAFIAIPPEKGDSLEDYRTYYGALARATDRPIFIQDTGPHNPTHMPVPFIIGLANAHPNLGYIKEEVSPVLDRMRELQAHRPPMKRRFSGDGGAPWRRNATATHRPRKRLIYKSYCTPTIRWSEEYRPTVPGVICDQRTFQALPLLVSGSSSRTL
jgi:hypothetical protein